MFRELSGVKEAGLALLKICQALPRTELLPLEELAGRILAQDIISPVNLPGFDRAAMDGYAVCSQDTQGASSHAPIYLRSGQHVPGYAPIRTGAPLPPGYDAVVMKEDVVLREDSLEVNTVVHPSKNVSRAGEDIGKGDLVLPQGHRLRPPDIALLGSLGLEGATVYERPKVAIIPTGGELVPVGIQGLKPGQAYEINRLLCRLYVGLWGGVPVLSGIVKDDPSLIKEVIGENCWADMILLLGGTSVGDRDYSPRVVDDLGELFFHGLRLAPGKPTALGLVKGKPVVCLPGYPVAALVALYLLVRPAIKRMAHLNEEPLRVKATLSRKISSRPGYVTVTRVAIKDGMAEPIMTSGAGILSSVTRSDGLVEVPEEVEGFEAGETVEVILIE